ncbi:Sialin [Orchesella cincta]|uniref:Sialin n=1 Tax=Orchesella cincta TaxID=48709 RepID=A0A1D2NA53_ORCCI|nr:Sialin [Orchesella cincta]
MTEKTERRFRQWQKRDTLAVTGFFGLALMYSLRFNISIGIVAMVDHSHKQSNLHLNGTEMNLNANQSAANDICPALIPHSSSSNESLIDLDENNEDIPTFTWNEQEQGLILGAFFWGYLSTQLLGGLLAQRYGGKWVISLGLLSTGILSFILPWAAMSGGKNFVLVIRVLQGISEGVMFPAFTVLLAKWTAPKERAGLATLCFSGMPFGTGITMIMSGHLISAFGWPAVFYAPGILTILWFICWSLLVYSSPKEHPTISDTERNYIEDAIKEEGSSDEHLGFFDIPWKAIFSSLPFWAIFMSHFANTWGHNTLKVS